MKILLPRTLHFCFLFIALGLLALPAKLDAQRSRNSGNNSTARDDLIAALKFKPVQPGVDYDRPSAEEIKECELKKIPYGWQVLDGNGRTLRLYLDRGAPGGRNKKDGIPDQWSYFKAGVEVYRDIDSDFDERTDQYRWLGTAGVRWGEDRNQDGKIDRWKMISAEEVSMEITAAIRENDQRRFERLLISNAEIDSLGVSDKQAQDITKRVQEARSKFASFSRSQKMIDSKAEWVHFGGMRPGMIAAGTDGSTKDVMIYDNVAAVVSNGRTHGQIAIGTLVKVGDAWRVVDLPEVIEEGMAVTNGGLFFSASHSTANTESSQPDPTVDANQKLYEQYAQLEKKLGSARGSELAKTHEQRAKILFDMSKNAKQESDRDNWLRQMADDISGAYLRGEFDGGTKLLQNYIRTMEKESVSSETLGYVTYRMLSAHFTEKLTSAKEDEYKDVEDEFNESLEKFMKDFPDATHVPDAMLQLALSAEFSGETEEASSWYGKIAKDFPQNSIAKKANGARIRLNCEGKAISFSGKQLNGTNWSLAGQRGKVVLIQFWDTNCEPCKDNMTILKRLHSKYDDELVIVGVSLDDRRDDLMQYLREARLPWTQLFEEGGIEGPLAEQLGIAILPTMLLIGKDGKVINRSITAGELDRAIQRATR